MPRKQPEPSPVEQAQTALGNIAESILEAFTPNPRRKGWETLSPGYRSRLERGGITEDLYRRGASLVKSRGHTSTRKEAEDKYFYRDRNKFIKHVAVNYGKDEDEVKEALEGISRTEIEDLISRQRQAEKDYNNGDSTTGKRQWEGRNTNLPDWFFYYHSLFS